MKSMIFGQYAWVDVTRVTKSCAVRENRVLAAVIL